MYGNNVIDLNANTLPFSCIVDGNEVVTDFQIVISRLKDNVVVFDTGMQKLATPFFPINNRNQNNVFSRDLKTYPNIASESNEFVNSTYAYYWEIILKNSNSGTETHSVAEVFYANSTPETTIYYSYDNNFLNENGELNDNLILSATETNILARREVYFKASYSQDENIPLKRYGWRLTDKNSGVAIMDTITKNQIYGTSEEISCNCTGLINESTYLLELYIETQNGHFDILQTVEIAVAYTVKNIEADFEIAALNDSSGIMLNWGNLRTTEGVAIGDVDYIERYPINAENSVSVKIPDGSSIVFSDRANGKTLELNEDSYIVLSLQFDKEHSRKLFEISGMDSFSNRITRSLEYICFEDAKLLRYTITKGNTYVSRSVNISETIGERCWYIVTLSPLLTDNGEYTELKVVQSIAENGQFPSANLYPDSQTHPYFGEWDSNGTRLEVI